MDEILKTVLSFFLGLVVMNHIFQTCNDFHIIEHYV